MIARIVAIASRVVKRYSPTTLLGGFFVLAVLLLSMLDHAGAFGYPGNDSRRFDRRAVTVTECVNGDTIVVSDAKGAETTVHLLGVEAPDRSTDHWYAQATKYLAARTLGRAVTLRLEPIQPRNDRGELLAYVFITDGDNLNADIVRDGQAFADRRVKHTFASQFNVAENEARKKPRGLWVDFHEDQMPQWRRDWLHSLRDKR